MTENTLYVPENDAAEWRELADQLTAEQVEELENLEQHLRDTAAALPAGYPYNWPPRTASDITEILLENARRYAGENLGAQLIGAVAPPSGAGYVNDWHDARFGVDAARRYFRGSTQVIDRADDPYNDDLTVEINGTQGTEGDITRHIMVIENNTDVIELHSAAHARELGLALIAAADEIQRYETQEVTR